MEVATLGLTSRVVAARKGQVRRRHAPPRRDAPRLLVSCRLLSRCTRRRMWTRRRRTKEGEEEDDEEDADELAELHERLVDVTNELVQERRKTQSLQSTCDQQREKLIAAQNLKKMQLFTRFGKFNANARRYALSFDDSDEDDDDDLEVSDARSDDSGVPTGPSAEAGILREARGKGGERGEARRREAAARYAPRGGEPLKSTTCEAEASRRQFLEGLREDFVKRFSAAFVEQIERGLPPQGSAVTERLQLASGYAPGSAPGYAPAPAVPPTPPPTHPMVKRMVGFDASLGL